MSVKRSREAPCRCLRSLLLGKVITTADGDCAVPFSPLRSSLLCHNSKGIVVSSLPELSPIANLFHPNSCGRGGFSHAINLQGTIQAFFPLHRRHHLRPTGVRGRQPLQQSSAKPCERALSSLGFLIFAGPVFDCPHVLAKHNPTLGQPS
jgi:hypothetical protein